MKKNNRKIKIVLIIFIVLVISVFLFIKIFNKHFIKLELNGEEVVKINLNDEYKDKGVKAKFLWKEVSNEVKKEDNINSKEPGNYYIKYSYNDKTIERKVIVIDNNVDTKKTGTYKVNVSVSDSSGNTTSKDITVTVKKKPVKNGTVDARIDVYLSEQKLYYFEKNKLILTSAVVTGKKDGTPRGNYKVLNKKRDVTLVGKTFTDHVDYWIAFIGRLYRIHDATWRDKFGGDIFKKDGSHGCVNMPIDNMKKLYERVEVGTAVNIYD